jgi:hypothetical protein
LNFELDRFAVVQRSVALHDDVSVVDEVVDAVRARDKAETAPIVEPLAAAAQSLWRAHGSTT